MNDTPKERARALASDARKNAHQRAEAESTEPVLLSVKKVASLCGCSGRHIRRLNDCGKMPRSIKLGALVKWNRTEILDWIAHGCPKCRAMKGGAK